MSTAIKVENLSKAYQLGQIGTGTISRDLERYWAKLRGKEDPFLKIGEANDRTQKGSSDIVWSLKDLNFEIEQGDAVGIIGRNGAGKSTLLKVLSRVTSPTTGSVKIKGRVASLLEVGTGFHPELSGRENIFLNGAILGMRKKEIARKFDEIVDFAGVERYIDTPVKRYSSGMYVRLAFAVAAHLESEILIVDEVLAVGDAEFQKKCLGKMDDVSKGEGRTVLFVSHNMGSVKQLCNLGILLDKGTIVQQSKTEDCIKSYNNHGQNKSNGFLKLATPIFRKELDLVNMEIVPHSSNSTIFNTAKQISIKFTIKLNEILTSLRIGFDLISDLDEQIVFRAFHDDIPSGLSISNIGTYDLTVTIPNNLLKDGNYKVSPSIGIHNEKWIIYEDLFFSIKLENNQGVNSLYLDSRPGHILPLLNWTTNFK